MSASTPAVTAGIAPARFQFLGRAASRRVLAPLLVLAVLAGFALRAAGLGAEGLSEDELNKWEAVVEYRERGLSSANGEHPMLMKALQAASVVLCERWNRGPLARGHEAMKVSAEGALRLPSAVFGALTAIFIFLVAAELFGAWVGLAAALLWSLDPTAVAFNRIAKEDTFFTFFFLLGNFFWLRGQSVAETGSGRFTTYLWLSAAAFGMMFAAKYYPHMLAVPASYYYIFQGVGATRWRIGKRRWLVFFVVMGVSFVACNLTILLPETWRQMMKFASERHIGHDAYEYMGGLYANQMSYWLRGVPWSFYYVFTLIKLPPPTVLAFLVGLPLLFLRRLGDGRYFLLFWFMYFLPFTILGGKFTRYYTIVLPAVHITAAVGALWASRRLGGLLTRMGTRSADGLALALVLAVLLSANLYACALWAPHYRLYVNALGGGGARAGEVFPHDEFYDASVRDVAHDIAARAPSGACVASEVPRLFEHYARAAGRSDLCLVSLSDGEDVRRLRAGDYVVVARGRRYFSNDRLVKRLESDARPAAQFALGGVPSARLYQLDDASPALLKDEPR